MSSSSSLLLEAANEVLALTTANSNNNAKNSKKKSSGDNDSAKKKVSAQQLPFELYDALTSLRLESELIDPQYLSQDKGKLQRSIEELFEKLTTYNAHSDSDNDVQRVLLCSPPLRRALVKTLVALYLRGDRLPLYARVSMLQGPLSDLRATKDNGPESHFRAFLFTALSELHKNLPEDVKKGAKDSFSNAYKHLKSSNDSHVKLKALELGWEAIRSLGLGSQSSGGNSGSGGGDGGGGGEGMGQVGGLDYDDSFVS